MHVGLCLEVKQAIRLVEEESTHWLDDHLRFILSRPREPWVDPELYSQLMKASTFKFSLRQLREEFRLRQARGDVQRQENSREARDRAEAGIRKGQIIVQLHSLFESGTLDVSHCSFNQPASGQEDKKQDLLAEWDFVIARHSSELPTPIDQFLEPYPLIAGGLHVVGEAWETKGKTLEGLVLKFQAMFSGHRPIHTLYYIARLVLISEHPRNPENRGCPELPRHGSPSAVE